MRSLRESRLTALILGFAFVAGLSLSTLAQDSVPSPQPQVAPPAQSDPVPQAQPQAPAQAPSQGGSLEQELQLTQDQKEKIAAVVDDENKQIDAVNEDTSLTLEQKQQKVGEIRQAGVRSMKAVLTPEQLSRLDAIVQQRQQNQGQQASPQH